MNSQCHSRRTMRLGVHIALVAVLVTATAAGAIAPAMPAPAGPKGAGRITGNYDIRVSNRTDLDAVVKTIPAAARAAAGRDRATSRGKGMANLRARRPDAEVRFSSALDAPEVVRSASGALTGAAPGRDGIGIVREYLRDNKELYGLSDAEISALRFIGESVSPRSGLRVVRVEQIRDGIPVFQSDSRFVLDREGRLVRSVALLVPGLEKALIGSGSQISAGRALESAMGSVGIVLDPAGVRSMRIAGKANARRVVAGHPAISSPVDSDLVYFPVAPGVLVRAWMQVVMTNGAGDYTTLVDAVSGRLLWRKDIRAHASAEEARFNVYVQSDGRTPADSPAPQSPASVTPGSGAQFPPIARTTVNMLAVQDAAASPNGWIADGGTLTTGNNVDAYLDAASPEGPDSGALDSSGRAMGEADALGRKRDFLGANFAYTPAPAGSDPDAGDPPTGATFRRGALTQLFYLANWYHDQLHALGFDEAAGNFQTDNFGRGGAGGDPVQAELQDAGDENNANFSTPPDGRSGRMQMYIFTGPDPDRDGSLDGEIVLHELTHGMTNRLIGNGNGLIWDPGSGMGEGWSDFYALALLNNTADDDPDGGYAIGAYATYRLAGLTDNYLYGIRRFPYSTDNAVNPLTWADVDDVTVDIAGGIAPSPLDFTGNGAFEVHSVGEVWALTLWEMRSRIIADPAGANGDRPAGNLTALQLVTDALKLTPINPGFIDAREAIIDADFATNGGANELSIWEAFADRGLGYKAVAPLGQAGILGAGGHMGIGESFSVPFLDVASVAVDDSIGNGNSAVDPAETIVLTVNLTNPWRSAARGVASATATLTSATPGVTITGGTAGYGAIPAQGTAGGSGFTVEVAPTVACGQSLAFELETTSSLGTFTTGFLLRVGMPSGTGSPVTFTRTIPGGIAIPDGSYRGITDSFAISDDLEIADVDFRVDSLTHTWTGDLTLMLKAPDGYGTDLIFRRGLFYNNFSDDGDNFVNTVIDDESANDLNLSVPSAAPFTGGWAPAFNSGIWNLFGIPNLAPDPEGQLGRLDGLSTKGTWRVHLSDQYFADSGTLNSWSLVVTPVAFVCSPTVSIDDVTVTEGNAGTATAGFTVSLSFAASVPVTVDYQTADGTAAAGSDYDGVPATRITFDPGETAKPVNVTVTGDTANEPAETFFADLSGATHATILKGRGVGAIADSDADNDGLGDDWELFHFQTATGGVAGDDSDGDGRTNLEEFLAWTGPHDPADFLHIASVEFSGGAFRISFPTVADKRYQAQRSFDLSSGGWIDLGSILTGTGGIAIVEDPGAGGLDRVFYRVIVLSP